MLVPGTVDTLAFWLTAGTIIDTHGRQSRRYVLSALAIEIGDKLHIITRRLFESDIRRHFVGEVSGIFGEVQEVTGYVFVFSPGTNEYKKRPESRCRIFSLGDSGLIVNKIPREIVIDALEYRLIDKRLNVTDGVGFALDVNEFGASS